MDRFRVKVGTKVTVDPSGTFVLHADLEELIRAARHLATEADLFQSDEGDGMQLADAIIKVEKLTTNPK